MLPVVLSSINDLASIRARFKVPIKNENRLEGKVNLKYLPIDYKTI